MSVSNLYELIEEGFLPDTVGVNRVRFKYSSQVDVEKYDNPDYTADDGDNGRYYIVDIDELTEDHLVKADALLVWLKRTGDANPVHVEHFRQLRHMMMETVGETPREKWDFSKWEFTEGPLSADIDKVVDQNIERIICAEEFSIVFTTNPTTSMVVVDEMMIGLLHYVNIEMTAGKDHLHATFTFPTTERRGDNFRIINRPIALTTSETVEGTTHLRGTFLEGHELRGHLGSGGKEGVSAEDVAEILGETPLEGA